jgi:hypothetical protein
MSDETKKISQRLFWFGLVIMLLIGGALLGDPGQYPATGDGSYLTPELVLEKLAPVGWLATITFTLFTAVRGRVDTGELNAGDVLALLKTEEFWIAVAGVIAVVFEIFGGKVMDDGTQALIVNVGLGLATLILRDYGKRTPGAQSWAVRTMTSIPQRETWK